MAILNHKPNRPEDAVEALKPMVYKLAHKYARNHRGRDFDDLVQDGFEGLMKAYDCFDGSKGRAFSSHAYQWIWAHIKDRAMGKWKDYNQTSGKSYEDHDLGEDLTDNDSKIDYDNVLSKMDPITRAIAKARIAGFSFREISEAMTKLGNPQTLHQVRNRYMNAVNAQ